MSNPKLQSRRIKSRAFSRDWLRQKTFPAFPNHFRIRPRHDKGAAKTAACLLSVQIAEPVMQKIHRLTDN
jgi:hypothetical protein